MTREEIQQRYSLGLPVPNRFTGRYGDRYFYKGREWVGPKNRIGHEKKLSNFG